MRSMFFSKILLSTAIVVVSGCATSPGCGMFNKNGEMTVTRNGNAPDNSYCNVTFNYKNTADSTVKPRIQVIFYDRQGNTISEKDIFFANINPGRSQSVPQIISCNGQTIAKMNVTEASDLNSCSNSGCLRICGVYKGNYDWGQ